MLLLWTLVICGRDEKIVLCREAHSIRGLMFIAKKVLGTWSVRILSAQRKGCMAQVPDFSGATRGLIPATTWLKITALSSC